MDLFTRDHLEDLAHTEADLCISLYMPTQRVEAERSQNRIRFKNLIRDARQRLEALDRRPGEVEALLRPAQQLLDRSDFWGRPSNGLAVFITPEDASFYRLPLDFEELVEIGTTMHLKPLFPLIASNNRFFLLALSQNQVRLYQGTHYGLSAVQAHEIPASITEALFTDDPERSVQWHTANRVGGRQDAAFHGQGVQDEDQRRRPHDALKRFFHQVNDGVLEALQDEEAPLVMAGVEYYLPLYRDINQYQHLIEDNLVAGNPDELPRHQLHERAWAIVEPRFLKTQEVALEQFGEQFHRDGLASDDLKEIVPAAVFGRIDTLFVPIEQHVWGRYDPENNTVELHDEQQADDVDLLNLAAVQAYLHGSDVHALRTENMPVEATMAATFRYPAEVSARVEA